MTNHPFHKAVWDIISRENFPESLELRILKDPACDDGGHKIYVGNLVAGTPVWYADVYGL